MKLRGEQLSVEARATVILPRPEGQDDLQFTIVALPLGLEEKAEELFPSPRPPVKYVRDNRGKILRDPKSNKPISDEDRSDPVFKKAANKANRRQMLFFLNHAILQGGDITFESKLEDDSPEGWTDYVDNILEEFKLAGFSMGDFVMMVDQIMAVSNMDSEVVEKAKEAFLSEMREAL